MPRATTGRKRDVNRCEYTQNGDRATCNHCKLEMAGLVARLKKHFNEYHAKSVVSSELPERKPKQRSIGAHMPKPSAPDMKRKLDRLVAQYIYSSNTPFVAVENREFQQMVGGLHTGYCPPNREEVSGNLLDSVYRTQTRLLHELRRGCYTVSRLLEQCQQRINFGILRSKWQQNFCCVCRRYKRSQPHIGFSLRKSYRKRDQNQS